MGCPHIEKSCTHRFIAAGCSSAEQQIQEQADHVRHMKEVDKLKKGDPDLDEAIAELLKRKDVLQRLQEPSS